MAHRFLLSFFYREQYYLVLLLEGASISFLGTHSEWRLLGLGFWQTWWMVAMCSDRIISDTFYLPISTPKTWVLIATTLGYGIVFILSYRFSSLTTHRRGYWIAALLGSGGTLSLILATHHFFPLISSWVLWILGLVGTSIANALLIMMWGELWSTLATGRVGRHLYTSYTCSFVLYFIIVSIPWPVCILTCSALTAAGVIVVWACQNEPKRSPFIGADTTSDAPAIRAALTLVFLSIVHGITQSISPVLSDQAESFDISSLGIAGICIAGVTLAHLIKPTNAEPVALYRPILPAMICGLIVMVLSPASAQYLGSGIFIAGIYCLDMLIMLVSTDLAHRKHMPVAKSFGAVIFLTRIGTLLGISLAPIGFEALLCALTPIDASSLAKDILLIEVIILVCAGMLLYSAHDIVLLYQIAPLSQRSLPQNSPCTALAKACRLTPRETEVLALLARGRTVRYIGDELTIAPGTVKHHVSNIYRKVGVVDRQGLLDALEQMR